QLPYHVADRARPLLHDVVIVAAERVRRDSAAHLAAPVDLGSRVRRVRIAEAHDGPVARVQTARVEAALGIFRKVSHRRVTADGEPLTIEVLALAQWMQPRKSNQHESPLVGDAR